MPMTPAQRFLAAIRKEVPDRVPVAPDISNYIPIKRTGLPFWDVYFHNTVPLWLAYIDAADYFGIEHWVASCTMLPLLPEETDVEVKISEKYDSERDAYTRETVHRTPAGDLRTIEVCFRSDPPSRIEKPVKNIAEDLPKYKYIVPMPKAVDAEKLGKIRSECRKREQAFGVAVGVPGFQGWVYEMDGGVASLSYAEADTPELVEEWFDWDMERGTQIMKLLLAEKPDYVLFGASGTITLASPKLAEKYALPALKKWSKMAREAGVATMMHSCGKSWALLEMLANETDVGSLNPLEIPPMGDVILADAKKKFGDKIGLMGNLHTTEMMWKGSAEDVRGACMDAMRDAGEGGGFVLSTGDQCGPGTPDENLFEMVRAADKYGRYDMESGTLPDLPPA